MNKDSEVVFLILARYALKNTIFRTYLYKDDWKSYLEEREFLFKKYNVPSLRAQTNQNFDYLIFVDPTFPFINEFDLGIDGVEVQEVDFPWGDGGKLPGISSASRKYCEMSFHMKTHVFDYVDKKYPNCKWLITTRLDTDDLLAKDFVQQTYDEFFKQKNKRLNNESWWISFENGYCYLRPVNKYIEYPAWTSCHIIFCEPFIKENGYVDTVWHRTHSKIGHLKHQPGKIDIISTPDRGWWMDIVGAKNLARHKSYVLKDSRSYSVLWNKKIVDKDIVKKYIYWDDE